MHRGGVGAVAASARPQRPRVCGPRLRGAWVPLPPSCPWRRLSRPQAPRALLFFNCYK